MNNRITLRKYITQKCFTTLEHSLTSVKFGWSRPGVSKVSPQSSISCVLERFPWFNTPGLNDDEEEAEPFESTVLDQRHI